MAASWVVKNEGLRRGAGEEDGELFYLDCLLAAGAAAPASLPMDATGGEQHPSHRRHNPVNWTCLPVFKFPSGISPTSTSNLKRGHMHPQPEPADSLSTDKILHIFIIPAQRYIDAVISRR